MKPTSKPTSKPASFCAIALAAILTAGPGPAFSDDEEPIELGADGENPIELGADENPIDLDDGAIDMSEGSIEILDDDGSGLEKMPELTEFVEARYPEDLIKSGVEGSVILELLVSETGAVDSVAIVRPLHPVLDKLAADAARQFKFSPAEAAGGEAVAVMLQYEYRFSLRDVVTMPDSYVNLTGRALERGTRRPVQDALVVLQFPDTLADTTLPMPFSLYMERIGGIGGQSWEDGRLAVTTDSTGAFKFYSLPSTRVNIRIQSPDYELFVSEERIRRLEETNITCYVTRLDYSDYELTVYGRAEEKEVSRRQISIAEVKRIPGLGGDALRVVQAMPGVARPSFGGTEVVVRGAPSWATRYYMDGVGAAAFYHMGGLNSIYPSEAIEAVDFYPGGWGARYGSAVGGVIEMRSRAPKTDRLQGHADFSMMNGALFLEGPIDERFSFMVSGRRNFVGDLLSLYFKLSDPEHTSISMAPFFWDYLLRADAVINKDHRAFVSLLGSRDSIGIFVPSINAGSNEVGGELDQMTTTIMFHILTVGLDSRIGGKWKNELRLSGTYEEDRVSMFGYANMEQKPVMAHLRDQVTYEASDAVTVNAGVDAEFTNADIDVSIITGENMVIRESIRDWLMGAAGGYVNVEWKPVERLLLVPGLRYDYYLELDYPGSTLPAFWDYGFMDNRRGVSGEPAFRLSGRYRLTDEHTAKAAVGTYSQTPQPTGMVVHETSGNPALPAVKAAHYVAGWEWQISELLNLDAQAYFNRMWDVARRYSARTDPVSDVYLRFLPDGRDRTYGLELMLRHARSEKFFGWVSYTMSRSETWSKLDGKYILSSRDEPHHLQFVGSRSFPQNFDIGARARFVSGKPTSPIVGTVENENGKGISPIYGERNSTRQDPFFQVDLRLDKKVIYEKWILTAYVDMQNVLWPIYRSPEMTYYNYNYTEKQNIAMIPMVAVGVRAEF